MSAPIPSVGLGVRIDRILAEHWPNSGVNPWYLADLLRADCSPDAPHASDYDAGLEDRYRVEKISDPTGKHDECRYFVLDPQHDPIAATVLRTYAEIVRSTGNVALADDIQAWVGAEGDALVDARAEGWSDGYDKGWRDGRAASQEEAERVDSTGKADR